MTLQFKDVYIYIYRRPQLISFSQAMTTKMKTQTLKWRQNRVRTWSSDSGCEVGHIDHDDIVNIVDDTNRVWNDMVNMYVQQRFNEAKDELINTYEGKYTLKDLYKATKTFYCFSRKQNNKT